MRLELNYDAKTETEGPNGSIRNLQELKHSANAGLNIAVELLGLMVWRTRANAYNFFSAFKKKDVLLYADLLHGQPYRAPGTGTTRRHVVPGRPGTICYSGLHVIA